MPYQTDDLRIKEIKELVPPAGVLKEFPITESAAKTVSETRQAIHRVIHGADDRLVVIVGPCSIHDVKAAKEYAGRLKEYADKTSADMLILDLEDAVKDADKDSARAAAVAALDDSALKPTTKALELVFHCRESTPL